MTLVIGLRCQDGVILAADSQATEGTGNVRYSTEKIFELSDGAVWAGSGHVHAIADVLGDVEAHRATFSATNGGLSEELQRLVGPVLSRHYATYVHVPGTVPDPPSALFIACGWTEDLGGWIAEIDTRNALSRYDARGFHAIGSGAGFAQVANGLMAHYDIPNQTVRYGLLVAFRAMQACIDTSAFGLGGPISIATVSSAGVNRLDQAEMEQLEADVGAWQEAERDFLEAHLSPTVAAEGDSLPVFEPSESTEQGDD